jgi:hypothetical protein
VRSPSRVQPVTRQARAALRRDKWTVIISDASIVRRQYRSYRRNRNYCGTRPYSGLSARTWPVSFLLALLFHHSSLLMHGVTLRHSGTPPLERDEKQ